MIKAIIFDIDGTLYEPIPELDEILLRYWVGRVSEYKRMREPEAETLYRQMRSQYKSSTKTLEVMGLGSARTITRQAENYLQKYIRLYIKRDRKIVELIKKLRGNFSLYTLRNGSKLGTNFILSRLGFENKRPSNSRGFGPFDDLLPTVELGFTKPNHKVFEEAVKRIGLPVSEIAVVGDRIDVDLVPAKKMGMKTILVSWNKKVDKHRDVDVVIESIYDMEELVSI